MAKIEQLLKGATNPRQKAMYQTLLEKARRQQVTKPTEVTETTETTEPTETTKPTEVTETTKPAQVTKPTQPAQPAETTETTETAKPAETTEATAPDAIFQAIGMLKGEVNFSDERQATVKLSGKEYPLLWVSRRWRAYQALNKQIEATGNHRQRLVGH